jgi:CubicO group peptidase (beta-lactamase class C family)
VTDVLPVPDVLPLVGGKLSSLAREHRVPGAQLAIHHAGRTVAVEFGEAEHGTRRRMTRDTAVPVGSVTKAFTATTAMVLVADGDLELDAPLSDHLPELGELGGRLTLRQLLSHTAGLSAGPDSEDVATASIRRYVRDHCRAVDLVLPPGTGFSYSNLGYVLAGYLIETVTGMDWWTAVDSILLRPLGIGPAAVVGPGAAVKPGRALATGHSVNVAAGRVRPVRQSLAAAEAPAGALAVSATDLVALGRLHLDGAGAGLLPAAHAAAMREAVPVAEPFGLADGWGLGLAVFDVDGTRWVGHDGNGDGTACHLRVDPESGWVIGFTSNANTGTALWRDLLAVLAGSDLPIAPPRPAVPPTRTVPALPGCAGTYANGGMSYVVESRAGGLYLSIDGDAFTRLTCHENLVFSVRDPATGRQLLGGRFVRDPGTGAVRAIQLDGRLASRRRHQVRDGGHARIA